MLFNYSNKDIVTHSIIIGISVETYVLFMALLDRKLILVQELTEKIDFIAVVLWKPGHVGFDVQMFNPTSGVDESRFAVARLGLLLLDLELVRLESFPVVVLLGRAFFFLLLLLVPRLRLVMVVGC